MKTRPGKKKPSHEDFIVKNFDKLKKYCRSITRNQWESDDLAQETVSRVLNKYGPKDEMCLSLLYRVAHNYWVDQLRKTSKECSEVEIPVEVEEPSLSAEVEAVVRKLFEHLNVQQFTAFILKDVFQYSAKDIAEILQITEGAVRAITFRVRTKLQKVNWEEQEVEQESEFISRVITSICNENPIIMIEYFQKHYAVVGLLKEPSSTKSRWNSRRTETYLAA
ncbi:RNA polymerase sigma-70 factor (ECF subfamily) [Bacillus pakistanensis]|uniref:RNA polymerase sigma-70 factor (ECF subfamily) n=1 Tax=Rossellomorea pakistanensis TaxID=992288 RepID=A0ABS2N8A3_9BACI|nr:sigma-70 family RNA polymerase sigma factor [Bacillus pakistanensis]MBM7584088.1 RNA polymerase sigma-70 factor (ECF subfamily) [Bacillus pakistanensis]